MEDPSHAYSNDVAAHIAIPTFRPRQVPDVPEDVEFIMDHLNDPNFDLKKSRSVFSLKSEGKEFKDYEDAEDTESRYESERYSSSRPESRSSSAVEFDDDSPYPEVRAAVASKDDPSIPVNTFRMWFLGLFFTIAVSFTNQLFSLRCEFQFPLPSLLSSSVLQDPSVFVSGVVAQLLALPMGKFLAFALPETRFNTFGYVWSLNPGPFNIKEHVCITVMANVVVGGAYATDVILTQKIFYGQQVSYAYQIMLVLSTQIFGFSFGGLVRQFVVWPSNMIWPGTLVNCALFNTLHNHWGKRERGHIPRERFFFIALACSFVWYWVPGFLFTALSVFTNAWDTAFLPISSTVVFDNTGNRYDPRAIVNADGFFDEAAYAAYSPMLMSATLAVAFGVLFAAFVSVFVHTFRESKFRFPWCLSIDVNPVVWFRRDIVRRIRSNLKDERDVHSRLMLAYPEVPNWWFGILFAVCFIVLLVTVSVFPTQLPAWAAFIGVLLSALLTLPLAMLQAITNQQISTQIMYEVIAGYMLPGRPVANMVFKVIGYIGTAQAT
ncbi:hypothetical protein C0992_007552 [Termitomyces sp. T32_za158]|nr:hypothetical protein C0992_007552 [Termitomyces sp. T32_za158]